jgi:pilus assembly protein Flp/PilA
MEIMRRLVQEEEGQGLVEYALILGLIVVGAITFMGPIGDKIEGWFQDISNAMGTTKAKP